MRVLVISQVVFSKTNNTGKTLLSYFRDFEEKEIAQLYFHAEIPTEASVCNNYYRFSDADALKSIFSKSIVGNHFSKHDIVTDKDDSRVDSGIMRKAYILGSKHTPLILLLRNLIWKHSNWDNMVLNSWIKNFNPEVIFFLSGDAKHTYDIARTISNRYSIPIVPVCVDDYYLNNRNEGRFLSKIQHKRFIEAVFACFNKAPVLLTICDKMGVDYSKMFSKPCHTLHTGAKNRVLQKNSKAKQLSYIGNLGYKRFEQLIEIGEAISELNIPGIPQVVDVYSGSIEEEYITPLKTAKGINFHGAISAQEVLEVMSNSIAVIHTESFDKEFRALTRYSVSTKIAESLMYGPCIIAYGPEEIASIQYLTENEAAYVITNRSDLKSGLFEILSNQNMMERIVKNARRLAVANHDERINSIKVRNWLQTAIDNREI